jgi:hypothetical protein
VCVSVTVIESEHECENYYEYECKCASRTLYQGEHD